MKTPKLPALESEPTNDTAALTCYALEWRDAYLAEQRIKEDLLAALEAFICGSETQDECFVLGRAAIAKARGES